MTLNWNSFAELPGSCDHNFEQLCRNVIWRSFSRYGDFRQLKQHPGVEFELVLNEDCDLGSSGQHFGWQCKWFDFASDGALKVSQRRQIEASLQKAHAHLPDLTNFVLWTAQTLTRADQKWYYALNSQYPFKLELYSDSILEDFLNSSSAYLKASYFGELVLLSSELKTIHEFTSAAIYHRYIPELHKKTKTELSIEDCLFSDKLRDRFLQKIMLMQEAIALFDDIDSELPQSLFGCLKKFKKYVEEKVCFLRTVCDLIESADMDAISDLCQESREDTRILYRLLSRLRAFKYKYIMEITNLVANIHGANSLLASLPEKINRQLWIVSGSAGLGKSDLCMSLPLCQ